MNYRNYFRVAAITVLALTLAQFTRAQTAGEGKIANMTVGAGSVRWDMLVSNSGGSVTISFPDGRSVKKAFRPGAAAEFDLSDKRLESLPDGVYNYELRLAPVITSAQKEAIMKARGDDDEPEAQRALRKHPNLSSLVQTGSFALLNGAVIGPGAVEPERTRTTTTSQPQKTTPPRLSANTVMRLRDHRFSLGAMLDDVIADDLIVQGSACVGLDCVNGESFSFDTIRLKENNTRISFNDTSTSAGFPTEDWTIRANSSSSGGANFLAIVDRGTSESGDESGTIVFEVDAGAPANSLRVSSAGKIGVRTASPVLDVHVNSSDTPAFRMEQNNSGGFSAQTWDIGANEANWFVRDVTGGSRLPFRIRPGAPTSSIDVAASGNVGIGTASPTQKVHVFNSQGNVFQLIESGSTGAAGLIFRRSGASDWVAGQGAVSANSNYEIGSSGAADATWNMNGSQRMMIQGSSGFVGIATASPTDTLSVNGTASKPGGGSWSVFSDERLKNITGNYSRGLDAVMRLQPLRYRYRPDNALMLDSKHDYIGFGAQSLQRVLPEAVSRNANGYLQVNNDPILWTMLNAIKEQQKEIESLKGQIQKLRAGSRKHRPRR